MGIFNKDGTLKPFAQYNKEGRVRQRDKNPDRTLHRFATRIPANVLEEFSRAIAESGDKVQTVVRNWMRDYSDKILRGGKDEN